MPTQNSVPTPGIAPDTARWRLVELDADGSAGPIHWIVDEVTEIGRRGRDLAAPDDEQMADHHASLVRESGEWFIADTGEGSGAWLRVKRLESWRLESGDQVWLGLQIVVAKQEHDSWSLAHYGPDGELRGVHEVGEHGVLIGRGPACELTSDDGLLSRQHARFCIQNGRLEVVDQGARNGTFVKVSGATVLEDGSEFRLATRRYRLEQSKK